jgi:hypothetical protein
MKFIMTDAELSAFLDEDLPVERMAAIEQALREDTALCERLRGLVGRRDAGVHTLEAIWRRHRLSCPSREQLGSYLLHVLPDAHADCVRFHLETIGCRVCNASLADLRVQHATDNAEEVAQRRHRYFQSSAGYLSSDAGD